MLLLNQAIRDLFTEVFQGTPPGADGTWFVQGNEALDATLDALGPEQASEPVGGSSTIAAHVIHTAYYLELANDSLRGHEREGDWAGSWKVQQVDDAAWRSARQNLREQRERFLSFLEEADLLADPERLTCTLANLGHAAYHLGAIRQIYLARAQNG